MSRTLGLVLVVAAFGCHANEEPLQRDEEVRRQTTVEPSSGGSDSWSTLGREPDAGAQDAEPSIFDRWASDAGVGEGGVSLDGAIAIVDDTAAHACDGIAEGERSACPLTRDRVRSVVPIERGVSLRLSPEAGSLADVQRRLDCYRAQHPAAPSNDPTSGAVLPIESGASRSNVDPADECLLSLADVGTSVTEENGVTIVQVTSGVAERVDDVQRHARTLSRGRAAAPRRTTPRAR